MSKKSSILFLAIATVSIIGCQSIQAEDYQGDMENPPLWSFAEYVADKASPHLISALNVLMTYAKNEQSEEVARLVSTCAQSTHNAVASLYMQLEKASMIDVANIEDFIEKTINDASQFTSKEVASAVELLRKETLHFSKRIPLIVDEASKRTQKEAESIITGLKNAPLSLKTMPRQLVRFGMTQPSANSTNIASTHSKITPIVVSQSFVKVRNKSSEIKNSEKKLTKTKKKRAQRKRKKEREKKAAAL